MDLLQSLLSNDNGTRSAAEAELERLKLAHPENLLKHLFESLGGSPGAVAMSSVLLRGMAIRNKAVFASLSTDDFAACRAKLLEAFAAEADPSNVHIRRIMGNAMAAVAGLDSQWPELLAHVHQQLSAADTSPRSLQLCLFLLEKLAEHIGPLLAANFDQVINLITSCLLENSPHRAAPTDLRTRTAAALTLLSFLHEVPAEALASTDACAEKVASCMSMAIAVLGTTLQQGGVDSDGARELFAALELLGEKRPQAFVHVWRQLLDLLATICNMPADSEHVDDDAKASALRLATCLLTNSATAELCSHADTRTAFLNFAMNFVADVEDEGMDFFLRPDDEECFGDSPSDESDSSQLPLAGAQCLSEMAACFDSAEIVQTCLAAAWKLVANQQDWKMRRAALFITANICEGASDAMRAILPQIVPQIIQLATSDPHPRVRYSALHCLTQMVHDFPGEDDEEDDDEEDEDEEDEAGGGIPSFQDLFVATLPPQICAALQASHAYPRNAACCVHLLRIFFDPNRLHGEHEILTPLMDYGLSIAAGSDRPLFLLKEVVVLFGNISQLAPRADLENRYASIMSVFRVIIGDLAAPGCSRDESTLKCLALEAYALVGKGVGKAVFAADAAALLNAFVRVLPSMDPSDPLSSYIYQSAGWMAGVLQDDFQPYVPHLLPGLIAGIAAEIDIEVSTDDGLAAGGGAKDGSVYQRGLGNVSVVCNSAQITDKEMACRVLTQFMLDVPGLVTPYVPDMVRALVPLVDQRFVFSEECAHVIGLCLSEALSVHLTHAAAPEPNHAGTVAMVEFVLQALAQALRRQQQLGTVRSSLSKHRLCAAIGCMREVFFCLSDGEHQAKWGLLFSHETLSTCLLLLRDEMLVWMQAKFAQARDGCSSDDAEVEEETRVNISDALGWVMRACPAESPADALMSELWAKEIQPYLDQEPFTSLFLPSLDDE